MLITPFSSRCKWVSDRAKKSLFVIVHHGFFVFVKLFYESIKCRLRTVFIKYGVAMDAKSSISKMLNGSKNKGLFIDCGSNLGQGFAYFRRFYPLSLYDYILVEPNPNCMPCLEDLKDRLNGNIKIIGEAASTRIDEVRFYGLVEDDRGKTTEGGSILKEHANVFYEVDEDRAITVKTFSLSDLIKLKKLEYPSIILKLDIEGGEYEVLDDLIKNQTHLCLDFAYVEFHSQYMLEPKRSFFKYKEVDIIKRFSMDNVKIRIWI